MQHLSLAKVSTGGGERLGAANFVGKESGDGGQRLASGDAVNHGDRGDAQMVVK